MSHYRHYLLSCTLAVITGLLCSQVAFAASPIIISEPVDLIFTNSALCGFPLEHHFQGTITETVFFDNNGNVTKVVRRWEGTETITNPEIGISLTSDFRRAHNYILDVT